MKRLVVIILLLIMNFTANSQIAVKSFRKLEMDMEARIISPIIDQNGKKCAIFKVVTSQTSFAWDFGMIGTAFKTEQKTGEIWVWVPVGARKVTINHQHLGVLRNYPFEMDIEEATVYEMILITGKVTNTLVETIPSQYIVITPEPADASIFIDGVFVKKGTYQAKLKPGIYNYRVQDPLYETDAGKFEITNVKKELPVKLKPNFGFISIATLPESGATVFIDDIKLLQTTPCTSDSLLVGEHKVRIEREMYQPVVKIVSVEIEKTSPMDLTLSPTFAEVTFNLPTEASLYINGEKTATGNWKTRLTKGIISVEARLDKHISAKKDIAVEVGENQTIDLQPIPIYGSLDVETNPPGATITINGLEMGKSPESFNTLLIGDYVIKIDRSEYKPLVKNVSVLEGQNTVVKETLSRIVPPKSESTETVQGTNVSKPKPDKQVPQISYSKEYYKYKKSKAFWLVSALVTGAAGTFAYLQTGPTYDQYKTASTTITATDAYKKAEMYNLVTPVAFGIAGFSILEFILKSGKQNKAKKQSLSFYPIPVKNGGGFALAYQF